MRIMIVDDNTLMRKEISKYVATHNDTVLECTDGESAIANCRNFKPDWILMDIKMKKMNGLAAAEIIKEKYPAVKIAIVTSYNNNLYREKAKSIGIDNFFLKNNLLSIRNELYLE